MREITGLAQGKVVNLASYRAERARQDLPLFAQPADAGREPQRAPARELVPRDVEHRERMLRFLGSTS